MIVFVSGRDRRVGVDVNADAGPIQGAQVAATRIRASEGTRMAVKTGRGVYGAYLVGRSPRVVSRVGSIRGETDLVAWLCGRDVDGVMRR